ncbi:hypothetical protein [Tenggerimyces flavus]|uniref:Uncharacterized protein n=1 Tax=Tenggerimyces flavus TaxID=1708749 RepID=A0ABV7YLL9_9ACTN|nr:hypothetical protein [Tenggerimyces flavus]MBM7790153.1 hypothetical protein [Tenggerimyces flavus]
MNVAERAQAWAQAVAQLSDRTVAAVAEALDIDPATLVDCGYQLETSTLPPGVEDVVFVPARTPGEIAYVELAVDLSIDELAGAFGPAEQLPARLHGGGQVAFDGIPGLAVVADTDEDRVRSLTFILLGAGT